MDETHKGKNPKDAKKGKDTKVTPKEENPRLIRFDWAMKRLLRNKANFSVLEGFLTTLLKEKIKIEKLLESESNTDREDGKLNRVDILAEAADGKKLLIEVQNQSENAFFHRILFGTSKLITDYINRGDEYDQISKVVSISLVYFDIGRNKDYVYYGTTKFVGLHNGEELDMGAAWKNKYKVESISDVYPEYYILFAKDFDKWSKVHLDQWMYFLSQGVVHENSDAPGLEAAKEKMRIDLLPKAEREAYYRHLDDVNSMNNIMRDAKENARFEGYEEGYEEGMAKGVEEGIEKGIEKGIEQGIEKGREQGIEQGKHIQNVSVAQKMLHLGLDPSIVAQSTGLPLSEIAEIAEKFGNVGDLK